ncbi:hypothetical protein BH24ACT22_BH24ACT22_20040 [soil metagenome]
MAAWTNKQRRMTIGIFVVFLIATIGPGSTSKTFTPAPKDAIM